MNPMAYKEMAETQARHWWFSGRRAIIRKMIEGLGLPNISTILEVGCGTGGNLQMLGEFGDVCAFEIDANAMTIAANVANNLCDIRAGCCPDEIPFDDQRFDLICMIDVLEHIERDTETLIAVKQLLRENGCIIMTVPAYSWLWGPHDEFLHHKRRYSANELREKSALAGLQPIKVSYFNTILFPFAVIARIKDRVLRSPNASGTAFPQMVINSFLGNLFGAERFLLEHFNLPFGLSLLCILKSLPR